jgi:DnaJ-class molecular chaperone
MSQMREECETCRGQGKVIGHEYNDQYDRTHIEWVNCDICGGEGSVEIELEEDDG